MDPAFGEIDTWHYPSASSVEIDSYVIWNFQENHWTLGQVAGGSRGVDRGVNAAYPMRVFTDGNVKQHQLEH